MDGKAFILISDNSCGIDPEEVSKIFNKFYRVTKNDRGIIPGCGLGLSIAYSIIEFHRGEISVTSELGKGTTFTLEFPLVL